MILCFFGLFIVSCNNDITEEHEHTFSSKWTYDQDKHYHLATCGHDTVKDESYHTFDDGVVTKEATTEEDGLRTYSCTVCNYKKEEKIFKLDKEVCIVTFKYNNGKKDEKITVKHLSYVTKPSDPVKKGYTFMGWFNELDEEWLFGSNLVGKDIVLNAKWSINSYEVNIFINDAEAGTIINQPTKSYKYEEKVKIEALINIGYIFEGWYENNILISNSLTYDFTIPARDTILEARFSPGTYLIIMDTEGVTYTGETSYKVTYGKPFTFPVAKPPKGFYFSGWEFEGELITNENGEVIDSKKLIQNMTLNPLIKLVYKYVDDNETSLYFGSYPQTLIEATSENGLLNISFDRKTWIDYRYHINGNVESYMFYRDIDIDNDGTFDYRGVYFTKYRPFFTTNEADKNYNDNGYFINNIYWFKYEPIKWNILKKENGKAFIMTEMILDSQVFDPYASSSKYISPRYEHSYIREWLNKTFYEIAFATLQKEIIEITEVDNSAKSTGDESNEYICENTKDKIFLLSHEEAITFLDFDESIVYGTDYAKCQGFSSNLFIYWLRSLSSRGDFVQEIYMNSVIGSFMNYCTYIGVRAVCNINLI